MIIRRFMVVVALFAVLIVIPSLASAGWSMRVCTNKTQASSIKLSIGLGGEDKTHREWKTWKSSDPVNFDMPDDIKNVEEIWIKGEAVPRGRNAYMCVLYNGHVVKHMDFDQTEEHEKSQGDTDDTCACAQ